MAKLFHENPQGARHLTYDSVWTKKPVACRRMQRNRVKLLVLCDLSLGFSRN